jgi:hypothetical protein
MEIYNYASQNAYIAYVAGYFKCLFDSKIIDIIIETKEYPFTSIEFDLLENKGDIIESFKDHLKENILAFGGDTQTIERAVLELKELDVTLENWFHDTFKYADHKKVTEVFKEIDSQLLDLRGIFDDYEDYKCYKISCINKDCCEDILSIGYTYTMFDNIVCVSEKIIFCLFWGSNE